MDKSQDMVSVSGRPKINVAGYTIEMGDTTYGTTLEERIQAARAASSSSKQMLKANNRGKSSLMNYRSTEKDKSFQNIDINKTTFSAHEFKEKNRQQWQSSSKKDFESITYVSSLNSTIVRNGNINPPDNYNSSHLSKPIHKGGGLMQRRLESIKANKRLSNIISLNSDTNVGSTKCSNYLSQSSSRQDTFTNNHVPDQFDVSKRNEYKTRLTIQKNLSNEIQHNNCINSNTNKFKNSVQYRLLRAKEEIYTKSKCSNYNNISKNEIIKKSSPLDTVQQINNLQKHNIHNKTKRLSKSNQTTTKNVSTIASNSKKILNNSNINKILNKQLITVQQKPVVPRSMITKPCETVISTNMDNDDILKKLKEKELNSFSFVRPQTNSVSQRLEKRNKFDSYINTQYNENDSMDWECISEPSQIVEKVNDLRKITHAYEPMEWTPDTIMHCDLINYCLVIDTNILLSDLKSITVVIDKYLPDYNGCLTIVLPWRVLQELDCIKKSENALGYRAREATRWLLEMLSKNHPRLKGQPMTTNYNYNTNADDSILKCAMSVKERVNYVMLVTDDKILSIKSEINGISVKNSAWLQNLVSPVKNPSKSEIFQEAIKNYPIIENKLIMQFESHLEHIIARVLKFAVGQNNDYSIFTKKAWWKMYSLKPPLSLTKCLFKLKEHWSIIVPQQLFKGPQKQLDWVECFFKDLQETISENSLNWTEIYNLLKYCTEILSALPYEYYHIIDMLFNDLMNARKCLKRKLDCVAIDDESLSISLTNDLNISGVNSFSNIDNVLLNISKEVDMFRLYTYKSKGISNNSSEQLNCLLPKNIDDEIKNHCHKLSNIINIMIKIKKFKTEQILESRIIIDTFFKAITDFDNNSISITKENIIDFCLKKNKNSFVSVLISFQNNLAAMKNLVTSISS